MRETSDPVRAAFRRAMTEGEIAGALAGARRIVVGYSGGADSSRDVLLRKAKDGKWYLWEQFLLVGIRKPESSNPWA